MSDRARRIAVFLALCAPVNASPLGRAVQDVSGPPAGAAVPAASETTPRVVEGIATMKFPGHRDWTSSGLRVRKGELVRVRAWGRIRIARAGNRLADPAGLDGVDVPRLVGSAAACQLIAVVGEDNNDYVAIGRESEFRAPHDGTLFLTINQIDPDGNTGDFDVRVSVGNASGLAFGHADRPALGVPAPTAGGAAPTGTPDDRVVAVQPRLDWTNTYITIHRGDTVVVEATGTVTLDLAGHAASPDGTTLKDPGKLIADKPTGALIAVVGIDNNDFIFVGSKGRFTSQRTGLLFLGINEENLANNAGSFAAHVRVERAAK